MSATQEAKPEDKVQGEDKPTISPPTPPTESKDDKAEVAKKEAEAPNEFAAIMPELSAGGTIVLGEAEIQLPGKREPGVICKVHTVRTRQLLAVGRVLTGASRPLNVHAVVAPIIEAQTVGEQQSAAIAAFTTLLTTVPHSEREFIALIGELVNPVDDALKDNDQISMFYDYLSNPDPVDTIRVLVQAYTNEEKRMRELGKALTFMFPALRNVESESEESQ